MGKLAAVGKKLTKKLIAVCGIAIACFMLAGGIGFRNKLAVFIIFFFGVKFWRSVKGVVGDCSYLATLIVVL